MERRKRLTKDAEFVINAAPPGLLEVDDMELEVEFVLDEELDEELVLKVEVDVLEGEVGATTVGVGVLDVVVVEDVIVLEVEVVLDDGSESFGQWVKVLLLFAA